MKLNYKRTVLIGLAFLSICAFWQMYDSIIPLILQNTFGIGETLTGVIMAADNVLAIFLLPLFGALSDKADTRLGKRMSFSCCFYQSQTERSTWYCLSYPCLHFSYPWDCTAHRR